MTRKFSSLSRVRLIAISYKRTLNTLTQWSISTNLAFNPTKCKVETISRKRSMLIETYYTMGDLQLEHCSHERDLGVWISTDLTWKKQVQTQSAKANKILGYVKRTTNSIKCIVRSEQSISLSFVHILHIPRRSGPLKLWTTSRTLNEFNDERQNTYSDYHITHTKNDLYKQI